MNAPIELREKQRLYASPNGDVWSIGHDSGGSPWVEHVPNQSSGGAVSQIDVKTFIASEQNYGPQHHALIQLLGRTGDIGPTTKD